MRTVNTSKIAVAAVMAMICLSGHALAADSIIRPTSVTPGGTGNWQGGLTINNSGLHSALNTGDEVPDTLPGHDASWYTRSGRNLGSTVVYDLGATYKLQDVLFWNYNEAGQSLGRGFTSIDFEFSVDGSSYSTATSLTLTEGEQGETVNLVNSGVAPSDISGVRFVRLTNFVSAEGPSGFNEIRFTNPPPKGTVISIL